MQDAEVQNRISDAKIIILPAFWPSDARTSRKMRPVLKNLRQEPGQAGDNHFEYHPHDIKLRIKINLRHR